MDDDPASCELVAYSLKPLGYRVVIASDGGRALNMALEDDIGIVIIDFHMPTLNGSQVLAILRQRPMALPIKVLVLTADGSNEVRAALEGAGIDGFLTKPVDLASLREQVTRLMPSHERRDHGLYRRSLDPHGPQQDEWTSEGSGKPRIPDTV